MLDASLMQDSQAFSGSPINTQSVRVQLSSQSPGSTTLNHCKLWRWGWCWTGKWGVSWALNPWGLRSPNSINLALRSKELWCCLKKTQHRDLSVHEITTWKWPGQAMPALEPEPHSVVADSASLKLHCSMKTVLWPKKPLCPHWDHMPLKILPVCPTT